MDLQADQKNNTIQQGQLVTSGLIEQDAEIEGRKLIRAARRISERDLLTLLRSWLLDEYIAPYCRALAATRIFRHCYWIDALDGVARSQLVAPTSSTEQEPKKGVIRERDPILRYPAVLQPIVRLSQELTRENRPIALYSLFLAGGSSMATASNGSGKKRLVRDASTGTSEPTPLVTAKESSVIPQSWLEVASQLLPAIERSPAIFLLNPLAPTMFTEAQLVALARRATPTELCLFLSHKQIITYLQTARQPGPAQPEAAQALASILRSDRWKTLPLPEIEGKPDEIEPYQEAITGFIALLSNMLKRHFTFPIQTISIPLLMGPATVVDAPYTLLFATKRQDSLFCMNDAICRYRQRLEDESYNGVLGEEWFREQQQSRRDEARQHLRQRILQQGRSQRIRRWPDLRQQILLSLFGQYLLQDYDLIIKQLLLSRDISCSWRKVAPIEEVERLPGNEDTLIW